MFGTLEQDEEGRPRLRFTRELAHPLEKVWRAVTEPEHLAHWFPTTIDGERTAGSPLHFVLPGNPMAPFDGEMLAFEPPTVMELLWGEDVIRIELQGKGDGTVLTLTDTLAERGKASRDGAGWHTCLDALGAHLHGSPDSRDALARWSEVHRRYVDTFGPEASTIGPPEGIQAGAPREAV